MKQTTYNKIIKKLRSGQPVFLLNDFYGRAIKAIPGNTEYLARQSGGNEYKIDSGTDLVIETMSEAVEITEQEYRKY